MISLIMVIFKYKMSYFYPKNNHIGFSLKPMMTKSELESTNLFKMMKILESNGYRPEGFRYRKDVAYTKLSIEDHMEKDGTFALYVDVLVNSYPPSLNDLYPNCFFEVPLIEQVYNDTKYQVKMSSISDKLFIPTREIIIAMRIHSLPTRGIRHKMVKDLCDLYGLLWYSPKSLAEVTKELPKFLEGNLLEKLKSKIDSALMKECEVILGEPKGSMNTVLNNLYNHV